MQKIKEFLASEIKTKAKESGLTQAQVAKLSNQTQPIISNIFNNKLQHYTSDRLFNIAKSISCEINITSKSRNFNL